MRRPTVLAVLLLGLAVAGCGESAKALRGDQSPAVTVPGTTIPYEDGGADGSGADGRETPNPRGGIAAGPDSSEPGDDPGADEELKPPRSGSDSP